tara:strand:- start:294 stop:950 length:657 start_codon:yes stop_codon:yes gene_type:complete
MDENEYKIVHLFPTTLFVNNIGVDEEVRNNVINEEVERMATNNGYFSKSKYLLDKPEYKNLKNKILKQLNLYTKHYLKISDNQSFFLQNSWSVKHVPGDWAHEHTHGNSMISGIYYVKTTKKSGGVMFTKPQGYTNLFHSNIRVKFDEDTLQNSETCHQDPVEGNLLLFPSHLVHSVQKNLSDEDRYCIAFNFFIEGEFFTKESKIDYLKIKEIKEHE